MLPPVEGIYALSLVVGSLIIGFILRTVLPFEYKRVRKKSIESSKEVKMWNTTTKELLQEVRVWNSNLRSDRGADLESTQEELKNLQMRIAKHASTAPDGVDEKTIEKLTELSIHIGTVPFVYNEFSVAFPETIENLEKIPFESEYDSVTADNQVHLGRVIRGMTNKAFDGRILPLVDDIEENLD